MKTLYESLLDNEEDIINDQQSAEVVLEQWCDEHLPGWKRANGFIKDGKINIKHVRYGDYVQIKLGPDGVMPDFVKWGNTFGAIFMCDEGDKIKSFKNFPTEFKTMQFYNNLNDMPENFTSWGEKVHCDIMVINRIKSLKGLEGKIRVLTVGCDELLDFNCQNLTVEELLCDWKDTFKVKSFNNLPKITEIYNISFNPEAQAQAMKANIKAPNKTTWSDMRAPSFMFDALNK